MLEHGASFVFTVLLWWLSTGVIIVLCALPKKTFQWSLLGASLLLVVACEGLRRSALTVTPMASYLSFLCAVGVWGWLEMTFLMGLITGPRKTPCPAGATGWHRFSLAVQTLIYHELSIAAVGAGLVALTWGAPNQTGTHAFLILMAMRISAKLNIYLGVPNLTDAFLPERLSYLKSYFRVRAWNWLFPVSILASLGLAIALAARTMAADGAEAIGLALLLSLVGLGILEHLFMMMPLHDAALWRWAAPMAAAKANDRPTP